jgi:aminopeptidase N
MDDQQALDAISHLDDAQERQQLRDQFAREGRSEAFWDALIAAVNRQAARKRDQGTLKGGARWVARKSGRLLGRAVRGLEQQSIRLDEEAKRKG